MYTALRTRAAARPISSAFSGQTRLPSPYTSPAALRALPPSFTPAARLFSSAPIGHAVAYTASPHPPPSPSPPPPPPPPPPHDSPRRLPRWARNLLIGTTAGLAVAWYDDAVLAHSLSRTSRTFYFGVSTALDFKLFWDADDPDQQDRIHQRTADKLHALLTRNGGLYIKLGQALAIQAAILPKPYREALNGLFDNAPQVPWAVADEVVRSELGKGMDELFGEVEHEVLASASIAQVYKARLRHPREAQGEKWADGEGWVAVKVSGRGRAHDWYNRAAIC